MNSRGMPLGTGFNARISCQRREGALLNLQTGRALFTYCEQTAKLRLGEYLKANYRSWLNDSGNANYFSAHDLFLVTGTYMTKNWEAAKFVTDSTSLGGGVTVEAMNLADGHFSIDWRTCNLRNKGFNTGHSHRNQDLPNHNNVPSFGACCHCEQTPENQCVFLRGWRIREMFRFSDSSLVIPISVECVKSVEWRRAQIIRKQTSKSISEYLETQRRTGRRC